MKDNKDPVHDGQRIEGREGLEAIQGECGGETKIELVIVVLFRKGFVGIKIDVGVHLDWGLRGRERWFGCETGFWGKTEPLSPGGNEWEKATMFGRCF